MSINHINCTTVTQSYAISDRNALVIISLYCSEHQIRVRSSELEFRIKFFGVLPGVWFSSTWYFSLNSIKLEKETPVLDFNWSKNSTSLHVTMKNPVSEIKSVIIPVNKLLFLAYSTSFIRGGSAPGSNPSPLCLAERVPLLYTLHWKIVPFWHT